MYIICKQLAVVYEGLTPLFQNMRSRVRMPAEDQATLISSSYMLNIGHNRYFSFHDSSIRHYAVKQDRIGTR
jgi:hypothetical protein